VVNGQREKIREGSKKRTYGRKKVNVEKPKKTPDR